MREYGKTKSIVWINPRLSGCAKSLSAYLFGGPHANWIGCFNCPPQYASADTGYPLAKVKKAYAELVAEGFIKTFGSLVFLVDFFQIEKVDNANVAIARFKEFERLPEGEHKALVAHEMLKHFSKHLSEEIRAHLAAYCPQTTLTRTVDEPLKEPLPQPSKDPLKAATNSVSHTAQSNTSSYRANDVQTIDFTDGLTVSEPLPEPLPEPFTEPLPEPVATRDRDRDRGKSIETSSLVISALAAPKRPDSAAPNCENVQNSQNSAKPSNLQNLADKNLSAIFVSKNDFNGLKTQQNATTGYLQTYSTDNLAESAVSQENAQTQTQPLALTSPLFAEVQTTPKAAASAALPPHSAAPPADESQARQRCGKSRPPVPYQAIVDKYNELLPELPAVVMLTEQRKKAIKGRWNEHPVHQELEFWDDFFQEVRQSDFLMGRTSNERSWRPNLDWLLKPANFVKVVEGTYSQGVQ